MNIMRYRLKIGTRHYEKQRLSSIMGCKIRVLYPGPFCDQITNKNLNEKNDQIQLKEIVTLKCILILINYSLN